MIRETYLTYRLTRPRFISSVRESHILMGAIVRNATLVAEQISVVFFLRDVRVGKPFRSGNRGSGKPV
jgi:hypothetical protein